MRCEKLGVNPGVLKKLAAIFCKLIVKNHENLHTVAQLQIKNVHQFFDSRPLVAEQGIRKKRPERFAIHSIFSYQSLEDRQ
jgi:hypothetical protein